VTKDGSWPRSCENSVRELFFEIADAGAGADRILRIFLILADVASIHRH